MTDEKLNQILKDALSPKISEEDIMIKRHYALNKKKKHKGLKIGAAAAAAVVLTISGIGVFNPALAAQIPIIGYTFQNMQDEVLYSGDYSEKAVILEESSDDTKTYSAESEGVEITASEVYCDGYSIFLAMDIKMNDRDLTNVTQHYIGEDEMSYGFYTQGVYTLNGGDEQYFPFNIDGNIIGNDTFAGMVKIDLNDKISGAQDLKINLTAVGFDDKTKLDQLGDSIDPTDWTEGNWNFDIPVAVDTSDVKVIRIDKKAEGSDLKLNEVVVSPYQVVVNMDVPMVENENIDEAVEQVMKDGNLTEEDKEEFIEAIKEYPMMINTLVYTQDGAPLQLANQYLDYAYFPVQNKDIEQLKIFVFGYDEDAEYDMQMIKEGINSPAAEKAILTAEVDVK